MQEEIIDADDYILGDKEDFEAGPQMFLDKVEWTNVVKDKRPGVLNC